MAGILSAVSSLWRQDSSRGKNGRMSSLDHDYVTWSPTTPTMSSPFSPNLSQNGYPASSSSVMPTSPIMNPASHPSSSHSSYSQTYPPLKHTVTRLTSALHATVPETLDTVNYPITIAAFNALQTSLRCTLPQDVKDYLLCMDGQDVYSANGPNLGALWGQLWLMSSEEILAEWQLLRRMEERQAKGLKIVDDPFAEFAGPMQGAPESCPPGWVRRRFSYPAWIPLARDDSGNYIGIDLDPPLNPETRHDQLNSSQASISSRSSTNSTSQQQTQQTPMPCSGQIIAFGRDIEGKVVLYPGFATQGAGGWARFLAACVDDMEAGEFATLGASNLSMRRSQDQSYSNSVTNRVDDPERANVSTADTSVSSTSFSWSEEDDQSDGIGELGYFEQHEIGQDSDSDDQLKSSRGVSGYKKFRASKRGARIWKLQSQYRGMGFVEALAARAKQRWAQLGMVPQTSRRSSVRTSSSQPRSSSEIAAQPIGLAQSEARKTSQAPGLGVQLEQAEGPDDGHVEVPLGQDTTSPLPSGSTRSSSDHPTSPNLVFSPASPKGDSIPLSSADESTLRQSQAGQMPTPHRRRAAPPPASISIPTADDLLGGDTEDSPFTESPQHTTVNMG